MLEITAGVHWVLPERLLIQLAQSASSMPEAIRKSTKGVHFRGLSKADAAQVTLLLLVQSLSSLACAGSCNALVCPSCLSCTVASHTSLLMACPHVKCSRL